MVNVVARAAGGGQRGGNLSSPGSRRGHVGGGVGRRRVYAKSVVLWPCRRVGCSRPRRTSRPSARRICAATWNCVLRREFSIPPAELRLGYCPYDAARRQRSAAPRWPRCPPGGSKPWRRCSTAAGGRRAESVSLALDGSLIGPASGAAPGVRRRADGGRRDGGRGRGGVAFAARSGDGSGNVEGGENGEAGARVRCGGVLPGGAHHRWAGLPSAVQEQRARACFSAANAGGRRTACAWKRARGYAGWDFTFREGDTRLPTPTLLLAAQACRRAVASGVNRCRSSSLCPRRGAGSNCCAGSTRRAGVGLPRRCSRRFSCRCSCSSSAARGGGQSRRRMERHERQRRRPRRAPTTQIRRFRPWFDRTPAAVQLVGKSLRRLPGSG